MRIAAIIMTRCSSSRFPNKAFAHIAGKPALEHCIERVSKATEIERVIVSTTNEPGNRAIETITRNHDVILDYGPTGDALGQFYHASQAFNADAYVRITGDCVCVDPLMIDNMATYFKSQDLDYITNCGLINPRRIPRGFDLEIVAKRPLQNECRWCGNMFWRSHVTAPFYLQDKYTWERYCPARMLCDMWERPDIRLVLDYWLDWYCLNRLFEALGSDFRIGDAIRWMDEHPELRDRVEKLDAAGRYLEATEGIWEDEETRNCRAFRDIAPPSAI